MDIKDVKKGDCVSVDAIVSDMKFDTTKRGTKYTSMIIKKKETKLVCRIWDEALTQQLEANSKLYAGQVCMLTGKIDEYMGEKQLVVDNIQLMSDSNPDDYVVGLDKDALYKEFTDCVNTMLTQKGVSILLGIFKGENMKEAFKSAYAAQYNHDNLPGGNMHHTMKVMKIVDLIIKLENLEEYRDLLVLGAALHDIGKLQEMKNGVYQENSFVSHRVFGIELLHKYKRAIIDMMDENFYYRLVSIIQGHHGEFGDPCNTVWAKIIHLADMLEACSCQYATRLKDKDYISETSGNYIRDNGNRLFF